MANPFKRHRVAKIAALAVCLSFGAFFVLSWLFPQPPIHLGRETGTYSNEWCGSVTFKYGAISLGNTQTPYVFGHDNISPFAAPEHFVGVKLVGDKCEVILDPSKDGILLRFDDLYDPKAVTLDSIGNDRTILVKFTRLEEAPQ